MEKQRLRRDLSKACKIMSREESINTALSTKSQGAGISKHSLKFKANRFRIKNIKKEKEKHMLCFTERSLCRKCVTLRRQTENINRLEQCLNRFTANSSKMGDYEKLAIFP